MPRSSTANLASLALGASGTLINLSGLILESVKVERRAAQFDLTLMMAEVDNTLIASFEYNTDLFERETIVRLSRHYQHLLAAICQNPQQPIGSLPLLSEEERELLLTGWNQTSRAYPTRLCLHQLVEAQVERTPDAVAIVCGAQQVSYRELNERAEQVAHLLRARAVGAEQLCAILLERSVELLVAVLGVLKAGGAYVPLDGSYPPERLRLMLEDARPQVVITQSRYAEVIRAAAGAAQSRMLVLDEEGVRAEVAGASRQPVSSDVEAANAAYVIYTSGSTGVPKGVQIQHSSLVNYIYWAKDQYLQERPLAFPLYSPLTFDLTVTSIFTPLITGNRIVIYADEVGYTCLEQLLEDDCVGILKLTPSHLALVNKRDNQGSHIKQLIVGGEALTTELARAAHESFGGGIEIFNEYGPTEATVGCMIYLYDVERDRRAGVPIGTPAANTQIFLLDEDLKPVPVGVVGELYLSGHGLARGYWQQPALTAERFVPHPFSPAPGARLYRTGDLARYLPAGEVEFVGRGDRQVKLRGYRIELGEVEAALRRQPEVREAAVALREDERGEKRLVAYYVVDEAGDEAGGEATLTLGVSAGSGSGSCGSG
jgi:fengycin family lipopeptide synthetase D